MLVSWRVYLIIIFMNNDNSISNQLRAMNWDAPNISQWKLLVDLHVVRSKDHRIITGLWSAPKK